MSERATKEHVDLDSTERPEADFQPLTGPSDPRLRRRRMKAGNGLRCHHCKCREMRLQPREPWEFILFLERYQCFRCKKSEHHVKLSWRMPITALLLMAVLVAVYHFSAQTALP
jgi:cytochrome c-type biogenesis protein CcmH/NrfF